MSVKRFTYGQFCYGHQVRDTWRSYLECTPDFQAAQLLISIGATREEGCADPGLDKTYFPSKRAMYWRPSTESLLFES